MIQAKTYAKSTFSSSMHDADLFLLQVGSKFLSNKTQYFLFSFFKAHFMLHRSKYIRRNFTKSVTTIKTFSMIIPTRLILDFMSIHGYFIQNLQPISIHLNNERC